MTPEDKEWANRFWPTEYDKLAIYGKGEIRNSQPYGNMKASRDIAYNPDIGLLILRGNDENLAYRFKCPEDKILPSGDMVAIMNYNTFYIIQPKDNRVNRYVLPKNWYFRYVKYPEFSIRCGGHQVERVHLLRQPSISRIDFAKVISLTR